jgi:hypothetical protein
MSVIDITTCEYVLEAESAAREAREKAAEDWSKPLSMAYAEVSLQLRKIVHRHIQRGQCASCREDETRRGAAASIAGLGQVTYSAVPQ